MIATTLSARFNDFSFARLHFLKKGKEEKRGERESKRKEFGVCVSLQYMVEVEVCSMCSDIGRAHFLDRTFFRGGMVYGWYELSLFEK